MASSAKELDLNPDVYIGLTYPIRKGINTDFELTKTTYEQAEYKAKLFGLDKIGIEYFTGHYLNKPYLFTYLKVID